MLWTRLFSKVGFERVLGEFWEDFGTILSTADHIVDSYFSQFHQVRSIWDIKTLALGFLFCSQLPCKIHVGKTLIRATKKRSMDGWMDGWMEKYESLERWLDGPAGSQKA